MAEFDPIFNEKLIGSTVYLFQHMRGQESVDELTPGDILEVAALGALFHSGVRPVVGDTQQVVEEARRVADITKKTLPPDMLEGED
jgi:hypothetical protein